MKQYEVVLKNRAEKALSEKLPLKIVDVVVNFIFGPLKENPERVGKKLEAPFQDQWSARRGDYRVVYHVDQKNLKIIVLDIEHRAHVYAAKLKDR